MSAENRSPTLAKYLENGRLDSERSVRTTRVTYMSAVLDPLIASMDGDQDVRADCPGTHLGFMDKRMKFL